MEKFGVLKMSTNVFRIFLEKTDLKTLRLLALDAGSNEPKEFILFKWKEVTFDNVAMFMKIYCEDCGYGRCDLEQSGDCVSMSIRHDLGKKGSTYIASFLTAVVTSTLGCECKVVESAKSVNVSFSK
jgi:hypothetical protein